MLIKHDLLFSTRNLHYAISFLRFINFDFRDYNFKRHLIKIVLINRNIFNKDNYLNNSIIIKVDRKIKLKLLL